MGLYGTVSGALIKTINSVVGITESLDNIVASANHSTAALRNNAKELEEDSLFECSKKQHARAKALEEFNKELEALTE